MGTAIDAFFIFSKARREWKLGTAEIPAFVLSIKKKGMREMSKEYEDAFSITYKNPQSFLEFLRERNKRTQWRKVPSSNLRYAVLETGDKIEGPHGNYTEEEWEKIAEDTRLNTRLVLQTEYGSVPVRDCAISSILQRAGISGKALPRLEKSVYAQVLNFCMDVSQGQALLCIADGKVSAVHGGDGRGYTVLEIPELFRVLQEYLEKKFPSCNFIGGYYDHSIVTGTWELGEESELIREYQDLLDRYGLESRPMIPAIRFTCSDIGTSGANLYPMLLVGEDPQTLQLGTPLRQIHKGDVTLADFKGRLDMIYSRFEAGIESISKLLEIILYNPGNCMIGICKELRIPQRLAMPTVERFKAQNGNTSCTAHEVYCAISEILFDMRCNGAEGMELAQMEETISRAIHIRWSNFDLEGEMKW